ncbi:MAG: adenosylcobinamide-GDP ribazoletransferase [bacterium]|nr:adenosylcobinamide-GDP ribazoletransferase [bacterium]MDE0352902.1 adenosylcobinamide-GDP ribazoletransferase [bacterium]
MKGLRAAIGFLTILPAGARTSTAGLSKAPAWFPVVGLLLGVSVAVVDVLFRLAYVIPWSPTGVPELESILTGLRGAPFFLEFEAGGATPGVHGLVGFQEIPVLLEGVVLVAVLALLTRCLHLDGLMDTCDALAGGHDRERRLEILRDPHVGAFGVVAVVLLLFAKVSALAALPGESRLWTIVLVPCLSRWAILVVMDRFPYVRQEGLGAPFLRGGSRRSLVVGSAVALLATVILTGPVGLLLGLAAGLVAWAVGAWAKRRIGGVTGDIYGAACETSEAVVLALAVVLTQRDSGALVSPFLALLGMTV